MRIFLSTIISVLVAATGVMAQPLPVPAVPNAVPRVGMIQLDEKVRGLSCRDDHFA